MNKPSLITRIRNRLKNKQGQSTTEYVLILAIVVMLASKMKTKMAEIFTTSTKTINTSFDEFNNNNP